MISRATRNSRQPKETLYCEARALSSLITNIEAAGAVDTMELRFHSSHSLRLLRERKRKDGRDEWLNYLSAKPGQAHLVCELNGSDAA
jgi:hypothetical protein